VWRVRWAERVGEQGTRSTRMVHCMVYCMLRCMMDPHMIDTVRTGCSSGYLPYYRHTIIILSLLTCVRKVYHTVVHYHTLPYTTMYYHTLPYTTIHYVYHTLPYTTIHYHTLPYTTIHYLCKEGGWVVYIILGVFKVVLLCVVRRAAVLEQGSRREETKSTSNKTRGATMEWEERVAGWEGCMGVLGSTVVSPSLQARHSSIRSSSKLWRRCNSRTGEARRWCYRGSQQGVDSMRTIHRRRRRQQRHCHPGRAATAECRAVA
jgi:hypothetical protein